jgi:hypothetical protein
MPLLGKRCSKCNALKGLHHFHNSIKNQDGKGNTCKSCVRDFRPNKRKNSLAKPDHPSCSAKNFAGSPAFKSKKAEEAYWREKERQNKNTNKGSFVYYCAWADRPNAVKIGFTTNVLERMKAFLTGSPSDLWLLAVQPVNGFEEEYALHNRFEEYKIRGEWFHLKADLFSYIASLDQAVAIEQFREFPEHYQSSIYVPSLSSFIEANL